MKKSLGAVAAALSLALCFCPRAAHAKPRLVIGAIYVGSVNDYGYNRSFHDALAQVAKELPDVKVLEAENVPESAEAERVMESMIQQGATLLFPTSFGHQEPAFNVAKRHPKVYFEHAGGWMRAPNFGVYFASTQTAWYAMGVAAGRMTKAKKLGFVIGMPIGFALGNVNAFELGARSVDPAATTTVVVTGGWSDKAKEAAAANALLDQGIDVVAMHVDSPATIIQTVEARGGMSIGFQSVEAHVLAPKGWITGLGFTWARFFKDVAEDVMKGQFAPAATYRGLGNMLALAPFGAAVPEDVRKQVTDTAARIQDGWSPFTGPITDNEGKVQIPAGQSWGGDKMGNFSWYVEGVVGKVK
jgi:basic membrane lipoprotein Med (substrate-binding protein (PBP1-ABC) superfamily)